MIPEIEDKFKIINWLRSQRHGYDKDFERLKVADQANLVTINATINMLIDNLKDEINEIAKEYGNSYVDDNGNTVWVKSELKGE